MVIKKKKKGSSLLVTVAMFAILSILIMSVLAMTTSGYSMRIKSNKRIENFYAADSGLEISQKALHDYLGKAVEYALYEADNLVLSTGVTPTHKDREEKFDISFKKFVLVGGEIKDNLGNTTEIYSGAKAYIDDPIRYENFKRDGKTINITSDLKSYDKNSVEIIAPTSPYKDLEKFTLKVTSNFIDKENKEREVAVDFDIIIPEYGKVLVRAKNSQAPNILDYIVGVDGDYTITTDTATTVLGDMWVKGKAPSNAQITPENKYEGGITIRQPAGSDYGVPTVKWDGKIATNATFKIEDIVFKSATEYEKATNSIFARNVSVNNTKSKKNAGNTDLFGDGTSLHVYNDFVMNGIDNDVVLKNYYGLNDINDYEDNWENKKLKNAQKSSSMIVNSSDFGDVSSIKVKEDLFVLGTSYLDLTGEGYQTGQSAIINNLSRPYTMRYDDYLYQYKSYEDGGIQLATKDKDGKELSLEGEQSKLDLAKKLYKPNSDGFNEGLIVENEKRIASPGLMFANGKALYKTPTVEQLETAKKKQELFAKEVFFMGAGESVSQKDFWNNKINEDVTGSFDWEEIAKIAKIDYNADGNSKVKDEGGNNKDFIHITTKTTLNKIMDEAVVDNHELSSYKSTWPENTVPHMIFSASDKELVLRNTGKGTASLEKETDTQIIYNVNIGNANDSPPLLVISKGKITFEPFSGFNHIMLISADDAEIKIPHGQTSTIGNYDSGNAKGDRKLINELFKYILESDKIIGDIGGGIFHGTEEKVAINAIEVSKLIKTKNWKLNK